MPRAPNDGALRATLRQLGEQIGRELADAIAESYSATMDAQRPAKRAPTGVPKRRPGRPPGSGTRLCKVPGCGRPHAAKGLCMNHYTKAKRLKMNADSLSDANLKELARDLRGAR
jgi:hypothetical protein